MLFANAYWRSFPFFLEGTAGFAESLLLFAKWKFIVIIWYISEQILKKVCPKFVSYVSQLNWKCLAEVSGWTFENGLLQNFIFNFLNEQENLFIRK